MSVEPTPTTETLERQRASYVVAALVPCDHRTAHRALEHGVEVIRPRRLREQVRAVIQQLHGTSRPAG